MFSELQKDLRCLIMQNHEHDSLPLVLPEEKIVSFYQRMCVEKQAIRCPQLRLMAKGELEPTERQLRDWSTADKWTNGWRFVP